MLPIYLSPRGRAYSQRARIFSLLPAFLVIVRICGVGCAGLLHGQKGGKQSFCYLAKMQGSYRVFNCWEKNQISLPDLRK